MKKPKLSDLPEIISSGGLTLIPRKVENPEIFLFWEGMKCPVTGAPVSLRLCFSQSACPPFRTSSLSRTCHKVPEESVLACRIHQSTLKACKSGKDFSDWWQAEFERYSTSVNRIVQIPEKIIRYKLGREFYSALLVFHLHGKVSPVEIPEAVFTFFGAEKNVLSFPVRPVILRSLLKVIGWEPLMWMISPDIMVKLQRECEKL